MKFITLLFLCVPNASNSFTTRSFGSSPGLNSKNLQKQTQNHVTTLYSTIDEKQDVLVIGGGWGGLSAAYNLQKGDPSLKITLVDASPSFGGLVRDGFKTMNGNGKNAEAGQHGFWDNYHNIFDLLDELELLKDDGKDGGVLTGYDVQGQYSPNGLEAEWPVYNSKIKLPTGLAQALYTKFTNLSVADRISAFPLVLAFSEYDNSDEMNKKYDKISFRDLCVKLGVSRRCYEEAFEPMILTGLFAPGEECSAAAALGMAYFFVLKSQNSFDVRWAKGNIGELIFQPWIKKMQEESENNGIKGVNFKTSTRVTGFEVCEDDERKISKVLCYNTETSEEVSYETENVIFAVGGAALNSIVRNSPVLSKHYEFRRYTNLQGLSVLATRLYFDRILDTKYSANACWGFDRGVGQTFFDITKLHGINDAEGSVIEVDYYHASSLLVLDDESIVSKVKKDLETILGDQCVKAQVLDAAVVRLPSAVNFYKPGSYEILPDVKSKAFENVFHCGDLVKTDHGSWSQEKAYVSGMEAANSVLKRDINTGIIPLSPDEPHVAAGRQFVSASKNILGFGDSSKAPSLVDFLW
eukprot:CAMPEP_0178971920 /NCGR_PEP_ID=MMETSP0789-20121207/20637_1 /TAXON_ID=3005 /ORGANISM="Rhizosolenia setigera, Strain CCMP 1694" /LENGTH=580 /DNA_ID=CAMNT_0020659133 /DNA_START=8 /DNA_END=1750 /DNA_ORIENTATION=-